MVKAVRGRDLRQARMDLQREIRRDVSQAEVAGHLCLRAPDISNLEVERYGERIDADMARRFFLALDEIRAESGVITG